MNDKKIMDRIAKFLFIQQEQQNLQQHFFLNKLNTSSIYMTQSDNKHCSKPNLATESTYQLLNKIKNSTSTQSSFISFNNKNPNDNKKNEVNINNVNNFNFEVNNQNNNINNNLLNCCKNDKKSSLLYNNMV